MNKWILGLAVVLMMGLTGCAALQKAIGSDTNSTGTASGSQPILPSANIYAIEKYGDFSVTLRWKISPAGLTTQNASIGGFNIYMIPPGLGSNPQTLEPLRITLNPPFIQTDFSKAMPPLDKGFGDYVFIVKTYDTALKEALPSNLFTYHLRGYLDFAVEVKNFTFGGGFAGTLKEPQGIAALPNGDFFVADTGHNQVVRFNAQGNWIQTYGSSNGGSGVGNFLRPRGIAISSTGKLYVADSGNDRVVIFDPANFNTSFETIGQFSEPVDCALDSLGRLYVADNGNRRVPRITFKTDGSKGDASVASVAFVGAGGTPFTSVIAVEVSGSDVYVLDASTARIYKFTTDGIFQDQWGSEGTGDGQFRAPEGLAVDTAKGIVYVSDFGNNRVQAFKTDKTFVAWWGIEGNDPGEFVRPSAIAFLQGKLYSVEYLGNRVQVFQ